MNLVTLIILMGGTVCSTFGVIYLGIWLRQRERRDYLVFALCCFTLAVFSVLEVALMKASTPEEYGTLVRWGHIPGWGVIVFLTWFVYLHLGAGRRWLLWTITILRTIVLTLNFLLTPNLNHSKIIAINQVTILGESISIAQAVPNPWMLLAQLNHILVIIFFADITRTVWRTGNRRKSIAISGAATFFMLVCLAMTVFVFRGLISWPLTISVFFTLIIIAMGAELSSDILTMTRLASELDEREADLRESYRKLSLSAGAANVGVWVRKLDETTISATDKWRELFEFEPAQPITFNDFMNKIHPQDREAIKDMLSAARNSAQEYETEYRIVLRNGNVRWISSRSVFEYVDGKAKLARGASVDITKRKEAEEAAHDLSQRLIGAQETERARLARELHDDLSQSLALLSIQLEVLGRDKDGSASVREKVDELTSQVQRLSSDVHRISHELHPSKLSQLGLEAALRGFCREIASAHNIKIDLETKDVPRSLSNAVSLCLYRVTQESLQNVQKHSGANSATVTLGVEGSELHLTISDNGCGFNTATAQFKESLGLISMRERVLSINAHLAVESRPGAGTRVKVSVPV